MRAPTPEVTVICTARNAERTISHTIESILRQEWPDWELLVVDDGSTDQTATIARDYALQDARITLFKRTARGRASALNHALASGRSELVAIIDADDLAHPMRLQVQHNLMNHHSNLVVLGTAAKVIRGEGVHAWTAIVHNVSPSDVAAKLTRGNPLVHSSVMMRRKPILTIGGYDHKLSSCVDYDLWVRCAAAGYPIGRIDAQLTAKRVHDGRHFANLPWRGRIRTSLEIQRRAGGSTMQIATRAAWLAIPQTLREMVRRAD